MPHRTADPPADPPAVDLAHYLGPDDVAFNRAHILGPHGVTVSPAVGLSSHHRPVADVFNRVTVDFTYEGPHAARVRRRQPPLR